MQRRGPLTNTPRRARQPLLFGRVLALQLRFNLAFERFDLRSLPVQRENRARAESSPKYSPSVDVPAALERPGEQVSRNLLLDLQAISASGVHGGFEHLLAARTDGQGTGGESRGTLYKLDIVGNHPAVARQRDRV